MRARAFPASASGRRNTCPRFTTPSYVDELAYVSQDDAEDMCRRLAREEGIFAGISAAGACWVALELAKKVSNATIVFVVCDRGDRYLSTGVFPAMTSPQ
jgi:cysteine synthase B